MTSSATQPKDLALAPAGRESAAFTAAALPAKSVSPSLASLRSLCLIARLHHVAADPAHLAHQLGWSPTHVADAEDLLLAARQLGLKAKRSRSSAERLTLISLPALAFVDDGEGTERVVVLAQCDGQRVLFQDPSEAIQGGRPAIEPLAAFAARWTGELILVTSRASLAGSLARFDFSWFIPSLVKYRRLFGEVLVVSLFLQLFALVSPLFFQVVMDKVLVHRGLSTLDVLVMGLTIVVLFESALTVLRTYVFSHTTSRIDVELGARLFRHLVHLPLSYFQARRVGDSVARVRELENIRAFLTGNALTLVLDVAFSVVFVVVMFLYSVPLTLIVLVTLPLYALVSLTIMPILRARLAEKFARGAENQALLVETITGIQTVKASALEPTLARRWENQLAGYEVDSIDDAVIELSGEGIDAVESPITWTLGAGVENLILAGASAVDGAGNSSDNRITGNGAANALSGGAGDDVIDGAGGNDVLDGGAGSDTYVFGRNSGSDTIASLDLTPSKTDTLQLSPGIAREDVFLSRDGNDLLLEVRGTSDSVRVHDHFAGQSAGGNQIDRISFADATSWDIAAIRSITNRSPVVNSRLGDLSVVQGSAVTYRVPLEAFIDPDVDDVLVYSATMTDGTALPDWLSFDALTRTLTGDSTSARSGLLNVRVTATDSVGLSASDVFDLAVQAMPDGYLINGTPGDDELHAGRTNDTLHGGAGDDALWGGIGSNTLYGDEGNDSLYGGGGRDTLIGGVGDDTYEVDSADDVVSELRGEGADEVRSDLDVVLGADVENATLTGSADTDASGNAAANLLQGNGGANRLDGQAGSDTLLGGAGDDTYIVDDAGDRVVENGGEGFDSVESGVTYVLPVEVETLTLSGVGSIHGTGNALDNLLIGNVASNRLVGNAGNDTLVGGGGSDTLIGGIGDDTYRIGAPASTVVEAADEGTDTVESGISIALGANLERLTLTGSEGINGTGNALANVIAGNSGANRIDGGTGADSMAGASGDDTYVVDDAGDIVIELAADGVDVVETRLSYKLGDNVENLVLTGTAAVSGTGNGGANSLAGNSAANILDGGAGVDTMIGGLGNDTYVVDDGADVVVEGAAAGTDLVRSSTTYVLPANVENLALTGSGALDGTGNDLANTLTGNSGDNILDGGAGADKLVGGLGNDTYVVDNSGDVVTEAAGAGTDTLRAYIDWTLAGNVENLTLIGPVALNGTGNALANVIEGNSGSNRINGAAGADTLEGGEGDDTYVVDNVGDVVVELAEAGIDTIESRLTWTLGPEIENLTLTGTGNINATGNTLANVLTGTGGANRLDGGIGADTMSGGAGNDTYVIDSSGDVAIEAAAQGIDTVLAGVSFVLPAEFEKLTLTGLAAIDATGNDTGNTIIGNAGDNRLDGGRGADTMTGGLGDDTYVVDDSLDRTVEAASGGVDTVESSISWALATQVENLVLTGMAAIDGTGNSASNTLTGNAAANVLNGGAGADAMAGGAGDDTYIVDSPLDAIAEAFGEGVDVVRSTVAWTLGSNLENLVLTGTRAISGTGNALDNSIVGNSAANIIRGDDGADRLDGGGGADTLVGGQGGDTYVLGRGYGADVVQENDRTSDSTDRLEFLSGIGSDQIWFRHIGNDLQVSVIGTSDKATLQNWYLGSQYHVDEFATSEGRSLLDSSVQELVTAMAAFSPPALGEMSLSGSYSTLLPVIAATWQASPADVSVNAQTLVAIPSALADAPDVIVDLGVGLDIDPLLEAQAGLGQTSAWPDQAFEMNPTNDATLRTQGAALIDAMATFSASGEAEFAVLTPHVFHAMPVAPNSLAA